MKGLVLEMARHLVALSWVGVTGYRMRVMVPWKVLCLVCVWWGKDSMLKHSVTDLMVDCEIGRTVFLSVDSTVALRASQKANLTAN